MLPHRNKKIEELSHGLAQIIQLLVTVIHDPRVLILDEPFSGLDPVNVKMVKDFILELKNEGKAIMLSTHRMNEVEEMCDRVFMINKGKSVLYGGLAEVKAKYRDNSVLVESEADIGQLTGVRNKKSNGQTTELFLNTGTTPQQVLEQMVSKKIKVNRFEISTPSLNDIFIRVAGG